MLLPADFKFIFLSSHPKVCKCHVFWSMTGRNRPRSGSIRNWKRGWARFHRMKKKLTRFAYNQRWDVNRLFELSNTNSKRNSPTRRGGTSGTPQWCAVTPEWSGVMASFSLSRGGGGPRTARSRRRGAAGQPGTIGAARAREDEDEGTRGRDGGWPGRRGLARTRRRQRAMSGRPGRRATVGTAGDDPGGAGAWGRGRGGRPAAAARTSRGRRRRSRHVDLKNEQSVGADLYFGGRAAH